ncbi:MAG: hypothetical protein HN348_07330 [Proteobacteria bacterium]|nr:hypothetical protein [Pseudomonadota bacterium]
MEPRVVIVTRPTEYDELIARHATHGAASWFLGERGQDIAVVLHRHRLQQEAVNTILHAIPQKWRHTSVTRGDLDRFLFEPEDLIVATGQDGLVANVAKYLTGQPVLGINPDPDQYEGVLVRHHRGHVADLLHDTASQKVDIEERTMIQATLDDGQQLLALNEIFIGHRSHQSARYTLHYRQNSERHSSSGLIVCSGTGATGWARSIHQCHQSKLPLPLPAEPSTAFFVREAWPSVSSRADITEGRLEGDEVLDVTSEMNVGGLIFGDGIESDPLVFPWGRQARVGRAAQCLNLVSAG